MSRSYRGDHEPVNTLIQPEVKDSLQYQGNTEATLNPLTPLSNHKLRISCNVKVMSHIGQFLKPVNATWQ